MMNANLAAFWDRACLAKGHTGYGDPLLHRYDQPVRLATIGRVLDRLFPNGLAGRAALDIGCGTGDFIAVLRRRGAKVSGVDISPVVLDRARQRFAGDANVQLQAAAIRDLAPTPGAFDVITSVTVLQHVLDDGELAHSLAILRAALRPEGRIVVLELAPPHAAPVEIKDASGFMYLLERPPSAWRAAFERGGLYVIAEPTFPQLGIALLRGFGWLLHALKGSPPPPRPAPSSGATSASTAPAPTSGGQRPLKAQLIQAVRRALLALAWPFDYVLRLPLPHPRRRHYRVFVLGAR